MQTIRGWTVTLMLRVLLGALLALGPGLAAAQESDLAIRPTDTSSPRATLFSFIEVLEDAYRLAGSNTPVASAELIERAQRYLDFSQLPPRTRELTAREVTLKLKEVLDRIELPEREAVPDQVEATGFTEDSGIVVGAANSEDGSPIQIWTIPGTNVRISQVSEGPREGEYLFSERTVERVATWYQALKDEPYRAGATPGLFDAYAKSPGRHADLKWVNRIPAWLQISWKENTLWQWISTFLILAVTLVVCAASIKLGRKLDRDRKTRLIQYAGWNWKFYIFIAYGLSLVAVSACSILLYSIVNLTGEVYYALAFGLVLVTYLFYAMIQFVAIEQAAEFIAMRSGNGPRSAQTQLIRLIGYILASLVVLLIMVIAADEFGLPTVSIVTGFGIGGLAVSLAARETLTGLFGSIVVMTERPFELGDYVVCGPYEGTVEKIGFRSTRLRTKTDLVTLVPNAALGTQSITNYGLRRLFLTDTMLRISDETPPDRVEDYLSRVRELLASHEEVTTDRRRVFLAGVGPGYLEIGLFFYMDVESWDAYLVGREAIMLEVLRLAQKTGVRLAPTQTLEDKGRGRVEEAPAGSA